MPLNCAMAFVQPIPSPDATVPSSALIRSDQITGYAEPWRFYNHVSNPMSSLWLPVVNQVLQDNFQKQRSKGQIKHVFFDIFF